MSEVLHAGAVFPAALGVCCVARDRARLVELTVGVVMVLAMLDMALGSLLLSAASWTAVLLGAAGALELGQRVGGTEKCRHSVVGTALMAVCAALMATRTHAHAMEAGHHRVSAAHALGHDVAGTSLLAVVVIGTLVYLPMTLWEMKERSDAPALQVAAGSMAASLVLMLLAATV